MIRKITLAGLFPLVLSVGAQPCDSLLHAAFVPQHVEGNSFLFSNTSWSYSPPNTTYQWTYGDGGVQNDFTGTHTFGAEGAYQVCLYAIMGNCVDTTCQYVQVGDTPPVCDASFGLYAAPNDPDSVHFYPTGTTATSWYWSFGDGAHSELQYPWHLYPGPGTYFACLTITAMVNGQLCTDTRCDTLVIEGGGSPCEGLNAAFSVSLQGNVATFNNAVASNDYNYHWQFGDGSSGFGPNPVHTYPEPGEYHACLIMWAWNPVTQDTCYADHCAWITVVGGGSPCDSLQACFEWSGPNSVLQFYNCSYTSGQPVHWLWHFGDGTVSDLEQPQHTFPGPGTYTVCMTVSMINSADTCQNTVCHGIVVDGQNAECHASFAFYTAPGNPDSVHFDPTGTAASWYHWDFGDGVGSNAQDPWHLYVEPGIYHACLTISSYDPLTQDTCVDDTCVWVVISGGGSPCNGLNAGFSVGLQGAVATFVNIVASNDYSYYWQFGDGSSGFGPNPVHTYPEPGEYHACLTMWAWDPIAQDTCFADHCQWITIAGGGSPCDDLSAAFSTGSNGGEQNSIFFSATSGSATHWFWSFGDGSYSDNGPQGTHTYAGPGSYEICLTAWLFIPGTQDTCSATSCQTVFVGAVNSCDSLNACFSFGTIGQGNILFTNCSTAPDMNMQFLWHFGDGSTSTEPSPDHTFPGPGAYTTCLSVHWQNCVDEYCHVVEIGGTSPCDSLWNVGFEFGHQGNVFVFYNTSDTQGQDVSIDWSFGDGGYGSGSPYTYAYDQGGVFTACLTISGPIPGTQDSCSTTTCHAIEVPLAIPDGTVAPQILAAPIPFTDQLTITGVAGGGLLRATLLDMAGRLVQDGYVAAAPVVRMEYGSVASGSYVLLLRNSRVDHALRVIKR